MNTQPKRLKLDSSLKKKAKRVQYWEYYIPYAWTDASDKSHFGYVVAPLRYCIDSGQRVDEVTQMVSHLAQGKTKLTMKTITLLPWTLLGKKVGVVE